MLNAYAFPLPRSQEALRIHQPFVRRLPRGIVVLNGILLMLTFVSALVYIVLVNTAASKSYLLRRTEQRVEKLKTENFLLRDNIATLSTLQSLHDRARELGLVPVEQFEFLASAFPVMAKR